MRNPPVINALSSKKKMFLWVFLLGFSAFYGFGAWVFTGGKM